MGVGGGGREEEEEEEEKRGRVGFGIYTGSWRKMKEGGVGVEKYLYWSELVEQSTRMHTFLIIIIIFFFGTMHWE